MRFGSLGVKAGPVYLQANYTQPHLRNTRTIIVMPPKISTLNCDLETPSQKSSSTLLPPFHRNTNPILQPTPNHSTRHQTQLRACKICFKTIICALSHHNVDGTDLFSSDFVHCEVMGASSRLQRVEDPRASCLKSCTMLAGG